MEGEDHRHQQQIRPYKGGGGGREDCWTEEATETLIEAWGNRYIQLSRGNLRQKDWKEVADAVNDRQDSNNKPRKTDIQCKNRIDTVKKKYKIEKAKPFPSKWAFFTRLDDLIGTNSGGSKKIIPPPLQTLPPANFNYRCSPNLDRNHSVNPNVPFFGSGGGSTSKSRLNSVGSTGSSYDDDEEDEDEEEEDVRFDDSYKGKGVRVDDSSDQTPFKELAKAITKFGEIYERIESLKQQQMMALERQRMELTKELEFQRMKMFMDTQFDIAKKKRPRYSSGGTGKKV